MAKDMDNISSFLYDICIWRKMNLMPQQQEAKQHLIDWKVGALFMEAGTGKTRVACELVNSVPGIDLVIWVGPLRTIKSADESTSVVAEINKWGGFNAQCVFYGIESLSSRKGKKYLELLSDIENSNNPFIVVDESLKMKNSNSLRTKRLLEVGKKVQYKLILNGTPISRNIEDLWSQMEFLSHDIMKMDKNEFYNTFCEYVKVTKRFGGSFGYTKEFVTGYSNIDYLYSLIRQYVYACDLHLNITQNYSNISYDIDDDSRHEYDKIKHKFLDDEEMLWRNNNIFLAMTQKMQHAYCTTEDKCAEVKKLLKTIPPKETIIFCKFIDSQEYCIREFPDCKVLSYQKESLGLNLQDYHYTIYWDKIWDLALRIQSGRRTYRTGQEYDCKYYDLTGDVGLESLIDKNIDKKVSMTEYFKMVSKEQIQKDL